MAELEGVVKKVLFVCLMNRCRSKTGEDLFKDIPGLQVQSAGVSDDAERVVTRRMVQKADIVFCFETYQKKCLMMLRGRRRKPRIVCLDILDQYARGDFRLTYLLRDTVPRYLSEVKAFFEENAQC